MRTSPIVLPPGLRPRDGRFGSGPSLIRNEALAALVAAAPSYLGTSHRADPVRRVLRRIREGVAALYGLPDDYEVAVGNGGATLFWDAACFSLIEARSLHYTFGSFSQRFAEAVAAAPHLADPAIVAAAPGSRPDPIGAGDADAVALIHNETSTGVWMPVIRPGGEALVLVDATSAAGALEVTPAEFDAYYFSPQKAFGSEGGIWVAAFSPAAVERAARLSSDRWIPPTLDLAAAIAESRHDQTMNTPALATLFFLADQIDWLAQRGGIPWAADRCRASAAILYSWAEGSSRARPFVPDPRHRSPTTVTLFVEGAVAVEEALGGNGYLDTGGYRGIGAGTLRFGIFPHTDPADVERLTGALDYITDRL